MTTAAPATRSVGTTLELRFSRGNLVFDLVVSMFPIGLGLWVIVECIVHMHQGWGWALGLGLYGLIGLLLPGLLVLRLGIRRNGRPALLIDEHRIVDNQPRIGPPVTLEWSDVASVRFYRPRLLAKRMPQQTLFIEPRDPEAVIARMPWLRRRQMGQSWRRIGFCPVITVAGDLEMPLEEVARSIGEIAGVTVEQVE